MREWAPGDPEPQPIDKDPRPVDVPEKDPI